MIFNRKLPMNMDNKQDSTQSMKFTCPIYMTLIIITLFTVTKTQAIVIRHDVDDKHYQTLAKQYKKAITYNDGCVGTVIAPKWVLTAAHCVAPEQKRPFFIEHLEKKYPVEFISIHPKNDPNTNNYDMALLRLKWPMQQAQPAILYPYSDELGKQVTFVGNGNFGDGIKGITNTKAILRAANNIITDTSQSQLSFIFDHPKNALKLEGISGPHDSGGPAFIEQDGNIYIAGVSSWQKNQGIEGVYGVTEYYARVSTQQQWITDTLIKHKPQPTKPHLLLTAVQTASADSLKKQFSLYPNWTNNTALTTELLLELIYQLPANRSQLVIAAIPELAKLTISNLSLPWYVIEHGNWGLFEYLIGLDININEKNSYGESYLAQLLMFPPEDAILTQLINQLIKNGLDINARDERGNTALALATYLANRDNNLQHVQLLLANKADPNLGDFANFTPLMYIASVGNVELAALFLTHGADISLRDSEGKTALEYVQKHNQEEMLRLLDGTTKNKG